MNGEAGTIERPGGHMLRVIESERLTLVAATRELVAADLAGRAALSAGLKADVGLEWPPDLFSTTVMRVIQEQLRDDSEIGWSAWYLLQREQGEQKLVGICQFKGRPDTAGSVEIAYSMLASHRNKGLATEAVARLVQWALGHQAVREVCAETLPYRRHSIRVLEKLGFCFAGPGSEQGVVRYVLREPAGR